MKWYLEALKKYVDFGGRARRKEYWFFFLFNIIITIALMAVDAATGMFNAETGRGVLSSLYSLAVLLPGIAVAVRRLHDIGKSGWWILIALIPCLGAILLIIWFVQDSQPGDNEYGPNPKLYEPA